MTIKLYKYLMLICYVLIFLTFSISSMDIYFSAYEYCSNIFGGALLFCLSEWITAKLLRKCIWQQAVIIGIASFCVINIVFIDNFNDLYYNIAQWTSFIIAWLFIIINIYKEEIKNYATQSK